MDNAEKKKKRIDPFALEACAVVLFVGLWLFGLGGLLTCVKTDAAAATDEASGRQAPTQMVDGIWYEPVSIQLKTPDGTVIEGTDWVFGQTSRTGTTQVVIDGNLYVTHGSNILLKYKPKS